MAINFDSDQETQIEDQEKTPTFDERLDEWLEEKLLEFITFREITTVENIYYGSKIIFMLFWFCLSAYLVEVKIWQWPKFRGIK